MMEGKTPTDDRLPSEDLAFLRVADDESDDQEGEIDEIPA